MASKLARIVIAGGNYAGLNALHHLYAGLLAKKPAGDTSPHPNVQITLIDRRDGFVHYIGITRGLTEPSFGPQLWVPYKTIPWAQHNPHIGFTQATIKEITANAVVLENGSKVEFDYLVVALGQSRFAPIGVSSTTQDEFVKELSESHEEIHKAQNIVVVGGGAVGVEMAADIKCDFPEKKVSLVHSRALPIPGPFSDKFREEVVGILQDIGVDVVLGERVIDHQPPTEDQAASTELAARLPERVKSTGTNSVLQLSTGRKLHADWVIRCLGTRNKYSLISLPGETPLVGPNGLKVKPTMQLNSPLYPHIFACGDICARDQVKLAGVAMYGAYIAARNITRAVLGQSESQYELADEFPSKLLLLMGKDNFAFQMGDEIWDKERTRPFVYDDMGLDHCIRSLSLRETPAYAALLPQPQ
ncbi:FAD/NAD(P)-binding domain-containing protein [Martensiomyces pterosporus]|nr:FAD/NAD(P)-binding domain-containing protein [Martensiomyces pterosporus]